MTTHEHNEENNDFGPGRQKKATTLFDKTRTGKGFAEVCAIKLVTLKKTDPRAFAILVGHKISFLADFPAQSHPRLLSMGYLTEEGQTHPVMQQAIEELRTHPNGRIARRMAALEGRKPYRDLKPLFGAAQDTDAPQAKALKGRLRLLGRRGLRGGVVPLPTMGNGRLNNGYCH